MSQDDSQPEDPGATDDDLEPVAGSPRGPTKPTNDTMALEPVEPTGPLTGPTTAPELVPTADTNTSLPSIGSAPELAPVSSTAEELAPVPEGHAPPSMTMDQSSSPSLEPVAPRAGHTLYLEEDDDDEPQQTPQRPRRERHPPPAPAPAPRPSSPVPPVASGAVDPLLELRKAAAKKVVAGNDFYDPSPKVLLPRPSAPTTGVMKKPAKGTSPPRPSPPPPAPAPTPVVRRKTATNAPSAGFATENTAESRKPIAFEVSPKRVAVTAVIVAVLGLGVWIVWPLLHRVERATPPPAAPVQLPEGVSPPPVAVAPVKPKAAPQIITPPPAPVSPTLALDARANVVEPWSQPVPDLALDPTHKYRLTVREFDGRLGKVFARLQDNKGWGVLNLMARGHPLQFAGVTALRLNCEAGARFDDTSAFTLDLEDLARRAKDTYSVHPTKCLDFEKARKVFLGADHSTRVWLPPTQTVKVGENVALKVAYRILLSDQPPQTWKAGELEPGQDVLAEGVWAQFIIRDAFADDNEGSAVLQLLPPTSSPSNFNDTPGAGAKVLPSK